ncbi:hypothetical protein Tco_0809984 [Tanacetum coccineum]
MVINSPCLIDKKELAIPGQTATGKEFSNPLMAGSLPKTISAKTRSERVLEQPNDPPPSEGHTSGSREGIMEQTFELMDTVLNLEKEKDAQSVECYDDDLDEEDASKQGRRSDKTKPMFKDRDFDELDDIMKDVEVIAAEQITSTRPLQVSTVRPTVSTVRPEVSAASVPVDTLIKIMSEKAKEKEKGVAFRDEEEPPKLSKSITTFQPLPFIDPKDKDAELAPLLHQEELAEVERRQKEIIEQEEASMAALYEEYDTIQASIDADALFAAKLQQEEREQFTIEERAKLKRIADSASEQKSSKKPKVIQEQESIKLEEEEAAADYEKEKEDLRMWLTVVPDEEETVDP